MITINANVLKAALNCAGKKDTRFYLNGVYLDFRKGRIVSTDGHCLFCGKIDYQDMDSVILPRESVEQILKALGKKHIDKEVEISINGEYAHITTFDGTRVVAKLIDAIFPGYELVINTNPSGELAHFDPEIMARCYDALRDYTGFENMIVPVQHNGGKGALIASHECLCILTPWRAGEPDSVDWYTGTTKLQEAA